MERFASLMDSTISRLLKCELVDFSLAKGLDFTHSTNLGLRNVMTVNLILGTHEVYLISFFLSFFFFFFSKRNKKLNHK